ncbi:RING/U-box superfamily protein [Striga hermonthica]|uniref:RING/U-box superfamily protein n=1 Tax=Striga hermonthica TaxID=68872 RepID=A0A9N7MUA9_STRHE|nr:RING/U-box superfamily protein [Striga hermonthica]
MGSSISRPCSSPRAGPHRRRRPSIRRALSSFLVCGATSSSREIEDYPAELLVHTDEHECGQKLRFQRKNSDLSLGNRNDLITIRSENVVSSKRYSAAHENDAPESGVRNVDSANKGKCLSESRELILPYQSTSSSRFYENASTSYVDQPSSSSRVSANSCNMNGFPKVGDKLKNSSSICQGHRVPSLDEASVGNNALEEVDCSNSDFCTSSVVTSSPVDFRLLRDDTLQDVTTSGLGFLVSDMEQSRQDRSLLHVDVVSISSNILQSNSAETSSREARRNSRRLFWDAFARRNSRGHTDSRTFSFSSADSDNVRPHDRCLLDLSGGSLNDEVGGDFSPRDSRTPSSNEQRWNSRSEIWERLGGGLDSTDHSTAACPRGIHTGGSCSCLSSSSAEEPGTRAGISRIVMLAEALFEVLDQIHQQPMSLSLSMVSLPAQESVVNSFPVKTHRKTEMKSADDVSQCYICLAEYEDGDEIRVLPCLHEYHMSCVDKWLKEIHGVCPLCRGDVREGFIEDSISN